MEIVVISIMLLVAVSTVLKLTFMKPLATMAEAAISAVMIIAATDLAAAQSKSRIEFWLQSPELMLDTSVLLTIDVALQIAFCIYMAGKPANRRVRIVRTILLYMPGILIFPILFACLVELIFMLPGTEFSAISRTFAILVLILLPLAGRLMKLILPERAVRLELIFYLSCIIGVLGVVATVNGRTAAVGVNEVSLKALGTVGVIAAAGVLAGIIIYNIKTKKQL